MSRTMPTVCEHGKTLDWGDFGPDQDNGLVGAEDCEVCDGAWMRDTHRANVDVIQRLDLIVTELRRVWPLLRGCEHNFDPECARCHWLKPLTDALRAGWNP